MIMTVNNKDSHLSLTTINTLRSFGKHCQNTQTLCFTVELCCDINVSAKKTSRYKPEGRTLNSLQTPSETAQSRLRMGCVDAVLRSIVPTKQKGNDFQ